jgi:two-component system, NtrC family, response regulator GlrR
MAAMVKEPAQARRFRLRVDRGLATPAELSFGENEHATLGSSAEAKVVLADQAVSPLHCEVGWERGVFVLRDLGSKTGTWLGGARVREVLIASRARFRIGACEVLFEGADSDEARGLPPAARIGKLIGHSQAMRAVISRLAKIAERDTWLLLEGEGGTGKELAAEGVHQASNRREGPFVVVDCGSIPPTLIEAELFGHQGAAYTGASQAREGAFARANGGTLFLDEIGELDIEQQSRLLRAIESREVKGIGTARPIPVDVRIIAATSRELRHEVTRGSFREDLYYRLAVARIRMPPLRDRQEDIPILVRQFLEQHSKHDAVEYDVDDALMARWMSRQWAGNVRELRNAVEQIVAFGPDDDQANEPPTSFAACATPFKVAKQRVIEQFEREYLSAALASTHGNITAAANAAEIDRVHMVRLLDRYGLRKARSA